MMMMRAAAMRPGAAMGGRVATRRMGGYTPSHTVSGDLKKVVQDMPPKGGYPDVVFKKATIDRGPEGWMIWAGALTLIVVGFYRVGQGNLERNAAKKEKREARMAIVPYLQAEEDARFVAAVEARGAEEAAIMKGVKDWKVGDSVYASETYWEAPTPLAHPRASG